MSLNVCLPKSSALNHEMILSMNRMNKQWPMNEKGQLGTLEIFCVFICEEKMLAIILPTNIIMKNPFRYPGTWTFVSFVSNWSSGGGAQRKRQIVFLESVSFK